MYAVGTIDSSCRRQILPAQTLLIGDQKQTADRRPAAGMTTRYAIRLQSPWSLLCYSLLLLSHETKAFVGVPIHHRLQQQQQLAHSHLEEATADNNSGIPNHIAFICDGNSRWAQARYLPASAGHAAGADRLLQSLTFLKESGVQFCTMYGFSTENWKRSEKEIRDVLKVIESTAKRFHKRAIEENVRIKILGDLEDEKVPQSLRETLMFLERETHAATVELSDQDQLLTVCLAINYGGRKDIMNASIKLAKAMQEGKIDSISEADFGSLLCSANVPDPDLVIRTGGEQRLSNFLLWELAYAELYFSDILWPDFDNLELEKALSWFSGRSRRFGGRPTPTAAKQP